MRQRLKLPSEGKARRWLALWLLPLVWMSFVSNVPHDHELEELTPRAAQSTSSAGAAQFASLEHDEHEHECLLCEWASAATAWLQIAVALGLPPALITLFFLSFHRVLAAATRLSNSRAPPVFVLFPR